jgi:hypothetical protein
MFNKTELTEELQYINEQFEFSPDCSHALKEYITKENLATTDDNDMMFLTVTGERLIGWTEEYGMGDVQEDITESFFHESGEDYEF